MKKAKIFQNGQSLAVRIPKEFRMQGEEVYIKRLGNTIVLIPVNDDPWKDWENSLSLFSDDFLEDRKQPTPQTRESL